MKRKTFLIGIAFLVLGVLMSPVLRCEDQWNYTLTSLDSHDFRPARNSYQWKGIGKYGDNNWHYEYSVTVIYYKVPGNLSVEITRRDSGNGNTLAGKFKAHCGDDPVLYDGVTCSRWTRVSGDNDALPYHLVTHKSPLCAIGVLFFSAATREALRGAYQAINDGPWTLAPMPVSPKENSTRNSPVTFEAFLPFRFALPCGGWRLTLLLERSDPAGGSYPWKKVDTGDTAKGYEGSNLECRFQKKMPLAPGKYRFKLQAEHYQKGKTPWSLPFEFSVTMKLTSSAMVKARHIVITNPHGGDLWRIRTQPYYVNWKNYGLPPAVLNGPVKIVLRRGSEKVKLLRKSISAKTGAARVYLKNDLPTGGGFFIRIRSTVDGTYFADSGLFSIMKPISATGLRRKQ